METSHSCGWDQCWRLFGTRCCHLSPLSSWHLHYFKLEIQRWGPQTPPPYSPPPPIRCTHLYSFPFLLKGAASIGKAREALSISPTTLGLLPLGCWLDLSTPISRNATSCFVQPHPEDAMPHPHMRSRPVSSPYVLLTTLHFLWKSWVRYIMTVYTHGATITCQLMKHNCCWLAELNCTYETKSVLWHATSLFLALCDGQKALKSSLLVSETVGVNPGWRWVCEDGEGPHV